MSETCDDIRALVPGPVSAKLALLRALSGELAREDWAGQPATVHDEALRVLEDTDAATAAVRGAALAAFGTGPGCSWYGHEPVVSFLVAETRITRPAARGHHRWAKRHADHPAVMAALGQQNLKASIAARICEWTGQLPGEHQQVADEILVGAWLGGCGQGDLAMLARQMREELCDTGDDGKPPAPGVRIDTTLDGAGVLNGDLTPGVTALVKAAFAKYAARQGTEDNRTLAERQHAALGQICRQVLSASGHLVPVREPAPAGGDGSDGTRSDGTGPDGRDMAADGEMTADEEDEADDGLFAAPAPPAGTASNGTAGSAAEANETTGSGTAGSETAGSGRRVPPVTALVHIPVAQLLDLPYARELAARWARESAACWAGETARNAAEPGYGGAWLTGDEARGFTAGARITPVVTACPDTSVLPGLAEAGARLHAMLQAQQHGQPADPHQRHSLAADLLGYAIKALSGPGGFASYLRTRLFSGTVLGSGSLVLDVGRSRQIPRQLRIAVALRDRHCSKEGCGRPAGQAQPHHVQHYARGGRTNPENLKMYCDYIHHHQMLHEQGWEATMHPDGTIDLYRPDGTRYTPGTRYQPPDDP